MSLADFIPILYQESFMLYKKVVCNKLSLELNNLFDSQPRT